MLRPCSSEIDDGLSLARQYGGRVTYLSTLSQSIECTVNVTTPRKACDSRGTGQLQPSVGLGMASPCPRYR